MGGFHDPHFVDAATGNIHPAIGSSGHISYGASARRDIGAGKLFGFWVELNDGIGFNARFAVPNHAIPGDGNAVRGGFWAAGRRPHLCGAGSGVL